MVVIAITGQPGAGSSTIAKLLAKKLKLKYFSPGEYFKSHSQANTQTKQVMEVYKSDKGTQKEFHKKIDEMQISLAKKGNLVSCGKLAIYMLKDIADYKIWLDCSLDVRAKRTAERDKLDYNKVKKDIINRQKMEVKEWKKDYGIDYRKQRDMADIVIDTSNLTEEETLNMILNKIK